MVIKILKKARKAITNLSQFFFLSNPDNTQKQLFEKWLKEGAPLPAMPEVKQYLVTKFQKQTKYDTLIETGTYLGQMIQAQLFHFRKIYSIELGDDLYINAKEKFSEYKHVELIHGDSGKVLHRVLDKLNSPAIFWLDGHYSEGITARGELICPIYDELTAIFNSKKLNHLILIDDERLFNGTDDYPTKNELLRFIKKNNPSCKIKSKYDMISVRLYW